MSIVEPPDVPAAWYPDQNVPGLLRWWDGRGWTSDVRPIDAADSQTPPTETQLIDTPLPETPSLETPLLETRRGLHDAPKPAQGFGHATPEQLRAWPPPLASQRSEVDVPVRETPRNWANNGSVDAIKSWMSRGAAPVHADPIRSVPNLNARKDAAPAVIEELSYSSAGEPADFNHWQPAKPVVPDAPDGKVKLGEPVVPDGQVELGEPVVPDGQVELGEPVVPDGPAVTGEIPAQSAPARESDPVDFDYWQTAPPAVVDEPVAPVGQVELGEPVVPDGQVELGDPVVPAEAPSQWSFARESEPVDFNYWQPAPPADIDDPVERAALVEALVPDEQVEQDEPVELDEPIEPDASVQLAEPVTPDVVTAPVELDETPAQSALAPESWPLDLNHWRPAPPEVMEEPAAPDEQGEPMLLEEQVEQAEPMLPDEQVELAEPMLPDEQVGPAEQEELDEPDEQLEPVEPVELGVPVEHVETPAQSTLAPDSGPVDFSDLQPPATAVIDDAAEPDEPVESEDPAESDESADPAESADPLESDDPLEQAEPLDFDERYQTEYRGLWGVTLDEGSMDPVPASSVHHSGEYWMVWPKLVDDPSVTGPARSREVPAAPVPIARAEPQPDVSLQQPAAPLTRRQLRELVGPLTLGEPN